ncbi:Gx transporter family protein [Acetanaerobacterium elongatum]|uniref:Heptaprenyl diphosphate synthase n=1 Tax=Acetanaerobacterium elongatum TaxID=258515 RepID=A0A1H0AWF0_9FIRM|nr:Gx transporter family protein [Acetanaerobacterium elongatum]SDN37715.1 heptaprenyl diphosphate synthase [Acetanaerobacterium elongatum]
MKTNVSPAKRVAFLGLLFALSIVLAFLESLIPTTGLLPNGVKLGLSNIVTMYAVFFIGWKEAYGIAILKSLFVLLTRGAFAAVLSLSGGLLSVTVMLLLLLVKLNLSYIIISIFGSLTHNLAQICCVAMVLGGNAFYYTPVLIISGIVMGIVTGSILKVVLPALKRIHGKIGTEQADR